MLTDSSLEAEAKTRHSADLCRRGGILLILPDRNPSDYQKEAREGRVGGSFGAAGLCGASSRSLKGPRSPDRGGLPWATSGLVPLWKHLSGVWCQNGICAGRAPVNLTLRRVPECGHSPAVTGPRAASLGPAPNSVSQPGHSALLSAYGPHAASSHTPIRPVASKNWVLILFLSGLTRHQHRC